MAPVPFINRKLAPYFNKIHKISIVCVIFLLHLMVRVYINSCTCKYMKKTTHTMLLHILFGLGGPKSIQNEWKCHIHNKFLKKTSQCLFLAFIFFIYDSNNKLKAFCGQFLYKKYKKIILELDFDSFCSQNRQSNSFQSNFTLILLIKRWINTINSMFFELFFKYVVSYMN